MDELLEQLKVGDLVVIKGIPFVYQGYELYDDEPGVFSIALNPVLP